MKLRITRVEEITANQVIAGAAVGVRVILALESALDLADKVMNIWDSRDRRIRHLQSAIKHIRLAIVDLQKVFSGSPKVSESRIGEFDVISVIAVITALRIASNLLRAAENVWDTRDQRTPFLKEAGRHVGDAIGELQKAASLEGK